MSHRRAAHVCSARGTIGPVYRPLPEMHQPEWGPPTRVEVDGEVFEVSASRNRPGQYHLAWVSGPNADYGFSVGTSDGLAISDAETTDAIRGFLAQVNPETGYIE